MTQSTDTLSISVQSRSALGSRAVNRLRRGGTLPGILYDTHGKSWPLQLPGHIFEMMLRRHSGQNLLMDLTLDEGAPRKVLLKGVQRHPLRDSLQHVDFLEVSLTSKLRVSVNIRFVGTPVGVTQTGGVLEHLLRTVEIECLPLDIVTELVLDVSTLKIGDSLFVRDLKIDPAKITMLTAPDIAIAAVMAPSVDEEAKPDEAAEAEETPDEEQKEAGAEDKSDDAKQSE